MKRFQQRIEEMLTAASFAEEGEFSTARTMAQGNRRILFALSDSGINKGTKGYALDVSKRTRADLDVLCTSSSPDVIAEAEGFAEEARRQGVDAVVVRSVGNLHDEIVAYTKAHANILFVVVNTLSSVARERDNPSRAWSDLPCPLVVVDGMSKA